MSDAPSASSPENTPWWAVSLRGMAMGAADVVPGVSGGTMALILGIYPRFIAALTQVDLGLLRRSLAALTGPDRWRRLWREWVQADLTFLLALGLGIGVAVVSLSKVIPFLLRTYPAEMNGLFFGMIAASTLVPYRLMKERGALQAAAFAVCAVFAYLVTGLSVLDVQGGLPYLFACGAIAISAMLLPGISGSFLLLILGQYTRVLDAIHERNLTVIAVFGLGVATGLLTFSRLLKTLLLRYPSTTLAALCGLMLGSLRKIWPFKVALEAPVMVGDKVVQDAQNVFPNDPLYTGSVLFPVLLVGLGFLLVLILERWGGAREA